MRFCVLSSLFLPYLQLSWFFNFFFDATMTPVIYSLSLHDALPISTCSTPTHGCVTAAAACCSSARSEEHTSELQSRGHLVCRLLLEKKNSSKEHFHAL